MAVSIGAMSDPSMVDPPMSRVQRRQSGRHDRGYLPLLAVAALALVAVAMAGWALFGPAPGETPTGSGTTATYSNAQSAEAKSKICAAFDTVRKGVTLNTNLQVPGGPGDVAATLAVAANARLSLYDGGQYLLARLEPSTPPELAEAVRTFANNLMDIGANATAGALNTDPEQAARLRDADKVNGTVVGLCA